MILILFSLINNSNLVIKFTVQPLPQPGRILVKNKKSYRTPNNRNHAHSNSGIPNSTGSNAATGLTSSSAIGSQFEYEDDYEDDDDEFEGQLGLTNLIII